MSIERARLMTKKDERRELVRPDAFQASADKFQKWLKDNQRVLIVAALLVVIGGAIVTFALTRNQSHEEAATEAYTQALGFYDKTDDGAKKLSDDEWRAQTTEKFTELAQKYPGTGPANLSQIYLGQLAAEKGDAAGAEKYFRTYLKNAGEKAPLAQLSHLALATALEDQSKLDEAASEYNKLIPPPVEVKDAKKPPMSDQALFGAARRRRNSAGRKKRAPMTGV